jgi:hypothetical protein
VDGERDEHDNDLRLGAGSRSGDGANSADAPRYSDHPHPARGCLYRRTRDPQFKLGSKQGPGGEDAGAGFGLRDLPASGSLPVGRVLKEPLGGERWRDVGNRSTLSAAPKAFEAGERDNLCMTSRLAPPDLVGRQAELTEFAGRLETVRQSSGSTILVGGEAGIGKTRPMHRSWVC